MREWRYSFTFVCLMEVSCQLHFPVVYPLEKDPPLHGTHWIGGWVDSVNILYRVGGTC
jgi:hypothetical protein